MMNNLNGNKLLKLIKQAGKEAVNNDKPVEVCTGRVNSSSPTEIEIVEMELVLPLDFFVFVKGIGEIEEDDILLLIRKQGGQKYYAIGKLN